jgi:DNA-binding MarR family transcriptional regulator
VPEGGHSGLGQPQHGHGAAPHGQPQHETQARWQVMWIAGSGHLTVPSIARRLGITRQSVQRVADELVAEGLASFQPNPTTAAHPCWS